MTALTAVIARDLKLALCQAAAPASLSGFS